MPSWGGTITGPMPFRSENVLPNVRSEKDVGNIEYSTDGQKVRQKEMVGHSTTQVEEKLLPEVGPPLEPISS